MNDKKTLLPSLMNVRSAVKLSPEFLNELL